ncbi:hypothetical protein [uncultured Erythrobacter sp.]|uniref:hypothetical protein n=1 Tax=uncultured Erythrobacter sp. TaxID=263913 RepID=UPI0026196C0E|nr:hypothetical protein [uncultured Erythrobacter sp.]
MDEEFEQRWRELVSKVAAQRFILDYVLKHLFLTIPKPERLQIAETLLNHSEDTSWLGGVSRTESHAERLADLVVLAQQEVDLMIGRALEATEKAEGSKYPPD